MKNPRVAQLVTDVVYVLCPYCSEPQPNPSDGSQMWTIEQFRADETDRTGKRLRSSRWGCVSCDATMTVAANNAVRFE